MAYCTNTLKAIAYDCNASKGGIVEAYVTQYADNIYTMGDDGSGNTVVSAITSGATWYKLQFRRNTSNATSNLTVDDANGVNYVGTDLVLQFARQDTPKRTAVAALALGGVAAMYKDANGKVWALGAEAPMYASAGVGQTGTAVGDGNNYQITLHDDANSFPVEVPADVFSGITIAS